MRTKSKDLIERIINYIDKQYEATGVIPSFREISSALNISNSNLSNYITYMKEQGLLSNVGGARGLRTNKMAKVVNNITYLPIVGTIACGGPILAEQNIERYVPVPNEFLGNQKGDFFILNASGNSMTNAGIDDGDQVIIRVQESAEVGQIVVALTEEGNTLKRYYLDDKRKQVRLHPENNKMKDMYFDQVKIQGVAIKVLKDLF